MVTQSEGYLFDNEPLPSPDPMVSGCVDRIVSAVEYQVDMLHRAETVTQLFYRLNALHLVAARYRDTLRATCSLRRDVPQLNKEDQ